MGAYHLLELAGLEELVLVDVNGKVKAGPRDHSRNPCVEYTQELIIGKQHGGFSYETSNITPTYLREFLSPEEEEDTLFLNDLEEEFFFQLFVLFFGANQQKLRTSWNSRFLVIIVMASGAISGCHP